MKAVILAGGYGTRLSEATNLIPKPMVEIGGKPILWHIMKTYSHYGINEFIICCGYKGYVIKEWFSNYFLHTSDVTFDSVSIVGKIFSNLDYAPYVEKGTGIYAKDGNGRLVPWVYCVKAGKYKGWHYTEGQRPHPFLEPARDSSKSKVERMLAGE